MGSGCCAPGRGQGAAVEGRDRVSSSPAGRGAETPDQTGLVVVKGGRFMLGSDEPDAFPGDGEGPVRSVEIQSLRIDARSVSNHEFRTFVEDTGYATDAERYGWSFVFHALVHPQARERVLDGRVPQAPWWLAVEGASWRSPCGPGSDLAGIETHPVVHVSWTDATAYAAWAGKRLPTEAEWEVSSRGGLHQARFPWGDDLTADDQHRCNIWQGDFPRHNTGADGYLGTAPVDAYEPNGYGLYNTSGNVWEWCADWWSTTWHVVDSPETRQSPRGPNNGTARVIRGGSYLCHRSYCNRYRVAARTSNTPDSSTGHMGFRCAVDLWA